MTTVSGGVGDAGGVSNGSNQMTSVNGGAVEWFVSHPDFPWRGEAFEHIRTNRRFDITAPELERSAITAISIERGRKDADGTLIYVWRKFQAVQDGVITVESADVQKADIDGYCRLGIEFRGAYRRPH